MRILLALIVTAAIGWSGYWLVGSSARTEAFSDWFEARRAEGWVAEVSDLSTRGFPNRFDTTFTDLMLADPGTGLAWEAPFFQLFALSYQPDHNIAIWPNQQLLATPLRKFRLSSEDMRASIVTAGAPSLPLERATLTAELLSILPDGRDQPTLIAALRLAAEREPTKTETYRLGLSADGVQPALNWRVRIDPSDTLPDALEALNIDMTVAFDKPWDRTAIETARPQPRQIRLKLAEARWGRLELLAAGEISVDVAGLPTGEIVIKARNWRDILKMAVASGFLPQGFADTLEDGLSLVSQMAGNPRTLDIPLNFRNGRVRLGPVPIGPAPVLKLR